ncbi:MAG: DUF393 domain-containing protein [Acidobacteria bacterium]|nr:MAG: DUF393 domain-containing protein [Acidobacteriota bacterium]
MGGAPPVLLYDGSCPFCSRAAAFVLRFDKGGRLRFAPLGSAYGLGVAADHPELDVVDSMVWLEEDGAGRTRVLVKSDAALQVARYLGGWFRVALALRIVPRRLRDLTYDFVARHRHRLRGAGGDRCFLPPPRERHRFLE